MRIKVARVSGWKCLISKLDFKIKLIEMTRCGQLHTRALASVARSDCMCNWGRLRMSVRGVQRCVWVCVRVVRTIVPSGWFLREFGDEFKIDA